MIDDFYLIKKEKIRMCVTLIHPPLNITMVSNNVLGVPSHKLHQLMPYAWRDL